MWTCKVLYVPSFVLVAGRSRSILEANQEAEVEPTTVVAEDKDLASEELVKLPRIAKQAIKPFSSVIISEIDDESMDVNVTSDSEPDGDPPYSPLSNLSDSDIPDDIAAAIRAQEIEAAIREDHNYSKTQEPWSPPIRKHKEPDTGGKTLRDTDL